MIKHFNKLIDKIDAGNNDAIREFMVKEFWHFHQLSATFGKLTPKWRMFSIIQYLVFVFLLIYSFWLILNTTVKLKDYDKSVAAQAAHITCGIIYALMFLIMFPMYRHSFIELQNINVQNYFSYGESFADKKIEEWENDIWNTKMLKLKILSVFIVFLGFVAIIGSPLLDAYQNIVVEAYVNEVYMHTPTPLWFPYEVNNIGIKIFNVAYQMVITVILLSVVCTTILSIVFNLDTLCMQIKILILSVKKTEERALYNCKLKYPGFKNGNKRFLYDDPQFIREYEFCIKQSVEHHLVILKAYQLINKIQKWPMATAALILSIVLALALFILIQGEKRIGPQLLSFFLLGLEATAIGHICWKSQELINLSEEVLYAFYNIKWIYCTKGIKNSLMIIQQKSRTPMALKVGVMAVVNLELFSSIVNTAYSYLSLLVAAQDDIKKL